MALKFFSTFGGLLIGAGSFVAAILIIILDGAGYINLLGKRWRFWAMLYLSHPVTLGYLFFTEFFPVPAAKILVMLGYCLLAGYMLIRLHVFPVRKNKSGNDRYFILYGARIQISACAWMIVIEILSVTAGAILFYRGNRWLTGFPFFPVERSFRGIMKTTVVWDLILVFILFFLVCFNASARVLVTSKRLRILRRLVMFFGLLIPVVNLYFLYRVYRIAKEEYYTECCRFEARKTRRETDVCDTKYPIVLVHGIAFRDFQHVNYWGRIPRILTEHGADIYYGHQQAWDTIEDNAEYIRGMIESVLEETGAEKVNIIAHSKGGLDSRYLISALHMEDRVASLTTVSTPHRGSEMIDILNRFPESTKRKIAGLMDKGFRKMGDKDPDCYHASQQLSPAFCAEFNEKYKDSPEVYYQSYASAMKCALSDYLFAIPHIMMFWKTRKPNDGLVTVESARWGNFRGVFRNRHIRGISHADMIDLRRDDIYSFDVLETYIHIVEELKEKGY